MLELTTYKKSELSAMFGVKDMEALKRKLKRYGITYHISGRGKSAVFDIQAIAFPFKIFCITELGMDAHTDFQKVRNLYYYVFNDDEFAAMPDEVKEHRMKENGRSISRQTIAGYLKKLENADLINRHSSNYIYYFAYKDIQTITDPETYKQAWREYFENKDIGLNAVQAAAAMRRKYGGMARKQSIPERNAIYNDKLEYMLSLINREIDAELEMLEAE